MKSFIILILLFISVSTFGQNVGINIIDPNERLHIQDNSKTKLLLKTTSGTSFFTADSPSNSGLLFRSSGIDKAFLYYSPLSNSLTASIGINGWTMSSNGDFRVKERIYSLNDLRLDATESITIEANGALIKIDPLGNIEIQGTSVSIAATDNLNLTANNIIIAADNALQMSSGAGTSLAAGNSIDLSSVNDVNINSMGDFNVESDNLDLAVMNATNINSGTGLALASGNLSVNIAQDASFSIGRSFAITTQNDLSLTVLDNYNLNVGKNYSLGIAQNYNLSAFTIASQASSTMNLLGSTIRFNGGITGFAMKGDSVSTSGGVGTITSGSATVFGN